MRLALHGGLILALLLSFGKAPYDHFHPEEPEHDHEHHAPLQSFARSYEADGEAAWTEEDHDASARWKDWLAGDGNAPSKEHAEAVSFSPSETLVARERAIAIVTLRNHDPPLVYSQATRAPPQTTLL
jgi:hypothetical protein